MYNHITVAGTFDHFHKGHKYLLNQAIENGKKISVGVTSSKMVADKVLSSGIEQYAVRVENVKNYLLQHVEPTHFGIFELNDIYGIAKSDTTLDAIYATEHTLANAEKVNAFRKEHGLAEMAILVAPLEVGADGEVVSSTRIRLGQIDREGNSYASLFSSKDVFTASQEIREELREPIGTVFPGVETDFQVAAENVVRKIHEVAPPMVITVGDIVTYSLQKEGYEPDISFIDHRSRRKDLNTISHTAVFRHGTYQNVAGTISSLVVQKYVEIIPDVINTKHHHQLIIEGEEDMLGLAAIMLAPLGAVVLYGQFEQGIVCVTIDEQVKQQAASLFKGFI